MREQQTVAQRGTSGAMHEDVPSDSISKISRASETEDLVFQNTGRLVL